MTSERFHPHAHGSIAEQAHAWVLLLASGRATEADAQALRQWRDADAAHAAAFIEARRAWRDLGVAGLDFRAAQAAGAASVASAAPAACPAAGRRLPRRAFLGAALGCGGAAAAALAVYPPLGLWPSLAEWGADYRTATGQQRTVDLGGGLTLALNTQTSVALGPAAGAAQTIELIAGEAAISRSHAAAPLEVLAGDARLVIGAGDIDVRTVADGICVTCLRGEVEIRHPQRHAVLRQNQQLSYDRDGVGAPAGIDPEEVTAWRAGVVAFRDTLLAQAVTEINRYRPGRVVLLDDELGRRKVSGRFLIADLDLAIEQIRQVFGATVRSLPGGVVLLS